jgi:hypothetical protein
MDELVVNHLGVVLLSVVEQSALAGVVGAVASASSDKAGLLLDTADGLLANRALVENNRVFQGVLPVCF